MAAVIVPQAVSGLPAPVIVIGVHRVSKELPKRLDSQPRSLYIAATNTDGARASR